MAASHGASRNRCATRVNLIPISFPLELVESSASSFKHFSEEKALGEPISHSAESASSQLGLDRLASVITRSSDGSTSTGKVLSHSEAPAPVQIESEEAAVNSGRWILSAQALPFQAIAKMIKASRLPKSSRPGRLFLGNQLDRLRTGRQARQQSLADLRDAQQLAVEVSGASEASESSEAPATSSAESEDLAANSAADSAANSESNPLDSRPLGCMPTLASPNRSMVVPFYSTCSSRERAETICRQLTPAPLKEPTLVDETSLVAPGTVRSLLKKWESMGAQ